MADKDHFWIGVKGALIERKHWLKMRESRWLFDWCVLRQTGINQMGEGIVRYGNPVTLRGISREMKGVPERTIRRWLARLKREGYLRVEHHSGRGFTIWIAKAKHKTLSRKVTHTVASTPVEKSRPFVAASFEQPRPEVAANGAISGPEVAPSIRDLTRKVFGFDDVTAEVQPPIPKGFTPKNLSLLQQGASAQTADSPTSLLGNGKVETSRQPQLPVKLQPSNPEFIRWQDKQAASDPDVEAFRKANGL